jgi:cytochrome c-type biogenesis protein CcmE
VRPCCPRDGDAQDVRLLLRVEVLAFLLVMLCAIAAAQAASTSPSEILANPDRFDGQTVTISGTITNLQERVSRAGNQYYTFDLSDGRQAVRVFSFGQVPCRVGGVAVEGSFQKVKQQGRYTFYSEVTATRVGCR